MLRIYTLFAAALLVACSPSQPSSTTAVPPLVGSTSAAFEGIGGSGSTSVGVGDSGDENGSEGASSSGDVKPDAGLPTIAPMIPSTAPCVAASECVKGLTSMVEMRPQTYGCDALSPCKKLDDQGACACFYHP